MHEIVLTCLLQDYKEKPDYGRCVAIVASASLREMIKPGALAIVSPIVVGGLSALCSLAFCHAQEKIVVIVALAVMEHHVFAFQW